jgi:hypothetical protein
VSNYAGSAGEKKQMILIGLIGGLEGSRKAVLQRLLTEGRAQLVAYEAPQGGKGVPGFRFQQLRDAIAVTRSRGTGGLVVTDIKSKEESDLIRKRGGAIWHIVDRVSDVVPIEQGDALLTATPGGDRHLLDPIEALHDQQLRAGTRPLWKA